MSLLRFLGLGGSTAGRDAVPESLIEIGGLIADLPEEDGRLAAAFAYLLARVAGSDLRTHESEHRAIAERLAGFAGIETERASLLTEAAIRVADERGASDDHLVARAFRDMTSRDEQLRLLRCLYAVAAADDEITTVEDNEIFEIATAIGLSRNDVIALRAEWKRYLATLRTLPGER